MMNLQRWATEYLCVGLIILGQPCRSGNFQMWIRESACELGPWYNTANSQCPVLVFQGIISVCANLKVLLDNS